MATCTFVVLCPRIKSPYCCHTVIIYLNGIISSRPAKGLVHAIRFANKQKQKVKVCLIPWINLSQFNLRKWCWGRKFCKGRMELKGLENSSEFRQPFHLIERGTIFNMTLHRRDTETLIVTLAQGQGGERLPARQTSSSPPLPPRLWMAVKKHLS